MKGTVKWFSEKKSFGFIEFQGKEFFVHKSNIDKNSKIEKGDKVTFEPEKSQKGAFAIKVRIIATLSQKNAIEG